MTTTHSVKTEFDVFGGWIAREWRGGFHDWSTM